MGQTDPPAKVASNDQLGLVERLRQRSGQYDEYDWHGAIELEAATEIERQRAVIGSVNARCDHLGMRLGEVIRERDALRNFAMDVLGDWPDLPSHDGGDLQDLALKHGLLRAKSPAPTKPCSEEGCACAEYYGTDFNGEFDEPVECYERTAVLRPNV